jgi:hypothetical protein
MKKSIFIFWILSFFIQYIYAQPHISDSKRNNFWITGYANPQVNLPQPDTNFRATCYNFNTNPLTLTRRVSEIDFVNTCATICDTTGQPLFFTNGFWVGNKNLQKMTDTINKGEQLDFYLTDPNQEGVRANRYSQAAVILPNYVHNNLYSIFHLRGCNSAVCTNASPNCDKLLYSVVDMNLDNGLGDLETVDNIVLDNVNIGNGMLTACRHANGRDWWLLVWENETNRYQTVLVTPYGNYPQGWQTVPIAMSPNHRDGQACFSPNGTMYARIEGYSPTNVGNTIYLFHFDRCTGTLSDQTVITMPYELNSTQQGVAFSPNSHYLYANASAHLYQYNVGLPINQVAASEQLIAVYDNFSDQGFSTRFSFQQLAPDDKIYMVSTNTTRYMHVIANPNAAGTACNFIQHGLRLKTHNYFTIPYQPYFKLGPIDGSVCDSLGIDNVVSTENTPIKERIDYKLYPNPTTGLVYLETTGQLENVNAIISNSVGQIITESLIKENRTTFNVQAYPAGVYFVQVKNETGILYQNKLIIVK